jgi:formylglycine-generating enzyme required for sulfatase activity
MGANVWEWVDTDDQAQKGTRGGSWWYGAPQMRADYDASKPRDMAVVYIGFSCVKDIR